MALEKTNFARSIDTILICNGVALGGQQNAILKRSADIINITNKINGEWNRSLSGTKHWSVICSGIYVINDSSFDVLNQAFLNNTPIEVSIQMGNTHYLGQAIITDFPINSFFDKSFKYNIELLGVSALQDITK